MKTAVLLYGFMRTYETTSISLIKNILEPNNADLFIYTYNNEGVSYLPLSTSDINLIKCKQGNIQDSKGEKTNINKIKKAYGKYLKDISIVEYNPLKFINDTKNIPSFGAPVNRMFSLYNNITEVSKLLIKYAEKNDINYDIVILARPDLHFYTRIDVTKLDKEKLNIPFMGGNIKLNGKNEIYYVAGYKNVSKCEYIPYETIAFSDQFIISSYNNMKCLSLLYSKLPEYYKENFPVYHSESVLYYHLGLKQNLDVQQIPFYYEILRNNYIDKDNSFILKCLNANPNPNPKPKIDKYREKLKNDFLNIKYGLNSMLKIIWHIFKYLYYRIVTK